MRRATCQRCGGAIDCETLPARCPACGTTIEWVLDEAFTVRDLAQIAARYPGSRIVLDALCACEALPRVNVLIYVGGETCGAILLHEDGTPCSQDEAGAWLAQSHAELRGRFFFPCREVPHD